MKTKLKPELLDDIKLEHSCVTANASMNRERGLAGTNSYTKELRFNPLEFLKNRLKDHEQAIWLDLCCGTGKALTQAAEYFQESGLSERIILQGIDKIPMFRIIPENMENIRLIPASLRTWTPVGDYDLITCVHGIHYIGDKLGLIQCAGSWLKHNGFFIANLDISDLRLNDNRPMGSQIGKIFRQFGIDYNRTKHILSFSGKKNIKMPHHYIGADDQAGPNYTGQPAVHSYYRLQADGYH